MEFLASLTRAFGARSEARRTVLFDSAPDCVLHRLAVRFGLPVLPDWAEWFRSEPERRRLIEGLVGLNFKFRQLPFPLPETRHQQSRDRFMDAPACIGDYLRTYGQALGER